MAIEADDVRNAVTSLAAQEGLRIRDVEERAGYTKSNLGRKLRSLGGPQSALGTLNRVAQALGVPVDELLRVAGECRRKRLGKGAKP